MLRVGTKVQIIQDLVEDGDYDVYVPGSMLQYKGKIATIMKQENYTGDNVPTYRIDVDGETWEWTEDLFITSKYQIGDRVVVRENLRDGEEYGSDCFVSEMEVVLGQVVTIKENFDNDNPNKYTINELAGYHFTDEMFQGLEEEPRERKVYNVRHEAVELLDKEMLMKEGFDTLDLCEIYTPTEEGMEAIWKEYTNNKGRADVWEGHSVLDILSQHPDYVPEKGYIVKKAEYERTVDFTVITSVLNNLLSWLEYNASSLYEKVNAKPWSYSEITEIIMRYKSIRNMFADMPSSISKDIRYKGMNYEEVEKEYYTWVSRRDELRTKYDVIGDELFEHSSIEKVNDYRKLFKDIRNWVNQQMPKEDENGDVEPLRELFVDEYIEKLTTNFTHQIRGIRAGQKFNKVIIKILTELGIKEKWSPFNSETARLGDACSPQKYIKYTIISANWIDYWRMSFGTGWCSCHNIDKKHVLPSSREGMYGDGCSSSGTESYMLDSSTVVMYTVSEKYDGSDYELQPKINRCMFHLGERKFIMGRVYPQGEDGADEVYRQWRQIFQTVIAECMGVPNYWKTQKDREGKLANIYTHGTHYPDYEMSYCDIAGWSWVKDTADAKPSTKMINIGHDPICPHCGNTHDYEENIQCCDMYGGKVCADCGCSLDEDEGYEIDGEWYCSECVSWCDYHEEYEHGEDMYEVHGYGWVCERALEYGDFWRCPECDEWFSDSYDGIETENGDWFCSTECAESAGFVQCRDDYWRREDDPDVHYCEECGEYVVDDEWDDEHNCCTNCVEDLVEEIEDTLTETEDSVA